MQPDWMRKAYAEDAKNQEIARAVVDEQEKRFRKEKEVEKLLGERLKESHMKRMRDSSRDYTGTTDPEKDMPRTPYPDFLVQKNLRAIAESAHDAQSKDQARKDAETWEEELLFRMASYRRARQYLQQAFGPEGTVAPNIVDIDEDLGNMVLALIRHFSKVSND